MATQSAAASTGFANRPSLTLKRRIGAAPEKVYAAWTDPQKIAHWFGPSTVRAGSLQAETDLRVGGVYREIVPNARLVFSWAWHSTPERESQVTVELKPDGDGTLLTLTHEQFFDQAARDNHARGWAELLDKLDKYSA